MMNKKLIVATSTWFFIILYVSISGLNLALSHYETRVRNEYYNWDSDIYSDWYCSEKSIECEKFFEVECGLNCYLVYGTMELGTDDWSAHMWNLVIIDGVPYEFESTTLVFEKNSGDYHIDDIQEGFYINGVEYEKSQKIDNWEGLI